MNIYLILYDSLLKTSIKILLLNDTMHVLCYNSIFSEHPYIPRSRDSWPSQAQEEEWSCVATSPDAIQLWSNKNSFI